MILLVLAALQVAPSTLLSAEPKCAPARVAGDIVVCGSSRDKERYRLPLPNERPAVDTRHPGDAPNGMTALTPVAPCGMFAGQRRCSKAEAAQFGYGKGRDPLTLVVRLADKIIDPDGD